MQNTGELRQAHGRGQVVKLFDIGLPILDEQWRSRFRELGATGRYVVVRYASTLEKAQGRGFSLSPRAEIALVASSDDFLVAQDAYAAAALENTGEKRQRWWPGKRSGEDD